MRLIVAPVSVLFRLEHCHLNEFYSRARVFVIFIVFCSVVCCKMKKKRRMLLLLSIGWYFQWFIWCGWSFTCHSLAHSHNGSDYKLCTEKSIYSQIHAGEEGTERECERDGGNKRSERTAQRQPKRSLKRSCTRCFNVGYGFSVIAYTFFFYIGVVASSLALTYLHTTPLKMCRCLYMEMRA